MAIPKFSDDLNIIGLLSDFPGSQDGLTPQEFKSKFDKAGLELQRYINNTLIPAIENTTPGLYSLTMDLATVVLSPYYWQDNEQTVSVSKVIADTLKQAVITSANPVSRETYLDCNINLARQGDGSLTFSCDDVPTVNVNVNVMILTKGG